MSTRGFVLVTGASGFVGRHLIGSLAAAGWRVRAACRHGVKDTDRTSVEWCSIPSIDRATDWQPLLAGGVTAVVHLAAVAHRLAPAHQVPASHYDEVNHLGTARLAEQVAATATIKRFVFVSSIGAVASASERPLDETSPCRPDTAYGMSKRDAERAVQRVLRPSDVDWTILRPPLLYGPGNPGNMARLLKLLGRPVPLPFGSVQNRRSFLFVGNLTSAIDAVLAAPGSARRLYGVADARDLSTPELIRLLASASSRRTWLVPCPPMLLRALGRTGDLAHRMTGRSFGIDLASVEKLCASLPVDAGLIRRECGWTPPFSIEDALRATFSSR